MLVLALGFLLPAEAVSGGEITPGSILLTGVLTLGQNPTLAPTIPTVEPAALQFGPDHSTAVISNAQKFILPIPILGAGGEPLVYPPRHHQAGQPIVDYRGSSIGDRGLVFFNQADQTVQAVAGDGNGVIIINEVTGDQAMALHQHIQGLSTELSQLTLEQLKQILAFAQDSLGLGDMYNSTRAYITEKMSPITASGVVITSPDDIAYGFKKRDDRDISQAIYIPGAFRFEGPAATPQVFDNGGVIVQQQDNIRGVQPEVFMRTYTFSDGRPISAASDLASQQPL